VKALLTHVRTDVQRHLALYDIARLPTPRGRTDDAARICTWADDVHATKRERRVSWRGTAGINCRRR
jgi:hypothetical protein